MTIPQKGRLALIKNSPAPEASKGVLVVEERELWNWVGDARTRVDETSTIRFAMDTVYSATEKVLEGNPRQPWIRRIEKVAGLSEDACFQRLMGAMLDGVRSGTRDGLMAAQLTSLCAVLMMAESQTLWPRDWDNPAYRRPKVWHPDKTALDQTPGNFTLASAPGG
jgi:hypothetical protein